ncbi:acyltransferase [Xanthovirga aplysinae]|uniref:acyltransferase n=1 Tax=Xanthovirga aplysinae TaxID=2529853 RepID=UPI0012BB7D53|nr:acyltransferase [Xanthovirga aplysinae]MTI30972.1 acyltransferase [Xanthovirga aplysinae]
MIKGIFSFFLKKFNKDYSLSKELPQKLLLRVIFTRGIMFLRSIIKINRYWVFLGRSVGIYNLKNIEFGKGVTIGKFCEIDGYSKKKIFFGESSKLGDYTKLSVTSHLSKLGKGFCIGRNSGIGEFSFIGASGGVEIGDDVIMGQYISFHSENHNFQNKDVLIREQGVTSQGIKIGNDVWVGAKVTFLDGAEVGDHSVVAAGAVVKDKFPSNCVIGGVPAKVIRFL